MLDGQGLYLTTEIWNAVAEMLYRKREKSPVALLSVSGVQEIRHLLNNFII